MRPPWEVACIAVTDPSRFKKALVRRVASQRFINDETALRMLYRAHMGKKLDLENPQTFNEKLQWLKLHDRNPLYTKLVDKIAVKDWVAKRIGPQFVTPTYAVWENVDDINLDTLPNQFVLKTNHDSGSVVVCRDRDSFDFEAAKKELRRSLKRNFFYFGREWPYKGVKPRVFAEEYLHPAEGQNDLTDYKFYCFNGEPFFLYVSQGLENHATARISFLSMDWKFAPFTRSDYAPFETLPKKPRSFDKMVQLSRILAKRIPFVRADFYDNCGTVLFSELTFSPCSGLMPFNPPEWDEKIGGLLDLNRLQGGEV